MKTSATVVVAWLLYALSAHAQPSDVKLPEVAAPGGPTVETLSPSELDALGLPMGEARVDTDFRFWGFADFSSSSTFRTHGLAAVAQGRHQSFYVGNLNFYAAKNLSESFRTMAEVRLTYLPNGSFQLGQDGFRQIDTASIDYANGQSQTRWGGIIIQRVYLEWTLHRLVQVRGGQFLTPFGIWNVDHGSPVVIPVQRPLATVSGLFPERQTGLEIFGRWSATNDHTLGYHLTLSNGTGPISEYKDLDRNKAVGGRLYWEYFGKTYVRAGISGYYGRDTISTPTANITATTLDLVDKLAQQYDSLALAADVLIKIGDLHLQTEWITQQRRYTEEGRTVHRVFAGAPVSSAASADALSWAGYVLAAYRFDVLAGLSPFATVNAGEMSSINTSLPDARFDTLGGAVGLNLRPIESVVFKAEYARVRNTIGTAVRRGKVNALLFQVAWAF